MQTPPLTVRPVDDDLAVIDVVGDITPAAEALLVDAYERAADGRAVVVLDFVGLSYMNSGGIGLLVMLLVRARREGRRLLASGLSDHYRQILSLTRLDEAIEVHATADDAVQAARIS